MHVVGLDHIVLTVASIERTVAFYCSALGMTHELFGPDKRSALRFGSQKINLHQVGREFEPKADRPTPGSADLCFLVDDVDAVAASLASAGVPILQGPVSRTGARGALVSYYVRDPDQNLVELSAYAKAAEVT